MHTKLKNSIIVTFISIAFLVSFFIIVSIFFNRYHNNSYEKSINKVVEIYSYDDTDSKSYGTGWFINIDTITTNFHVISYIEDEDVKIYKKICIRFCDEEKYTDVSMIKYDESKDIAFLKYSGVHKHSSFKEGGFKTGDNCFSIGNYNNYGLSYKNGIISLKEVYLNYNDLNQTFIQCEINIGKGDSGAPIFNQQGKVLGMISFRKANSSGVIEQGFAYAIPIERIVEYYNKTD